MAATALSLLLPPGPSSHDGAHGLASPTSFLQDTSKSDTRQGRAVMRFHARAPHAKLLRAPDTVRARSFCGVGVGDGRRTPNIAPVWWVVVVVARARAALTRAAWVWVRKRPALRAECLVDGQVIKSPAFESVSAKGLWTSVGKLVGRGLGMKDAKRAVSLAFIRERGPNTSSSALDFSFVLGRLYVASCLCLSSVVPEPCLFLSASLLPCLPVCLYVCTSVPPSWMSREQATMYEYTDEMNVPKNLRGSYIRRGRGEHSVVDRAAFRRRRR